MLAQWHASRYAWVVHAFGGVSLAYVLSRALLATLGVKYGTYNFAVGWQGQGDRHWLLARMGDTTSPHVWAWWMLGLVGAYVAWQTHRPLVGLLSVAFMGAVHELVWYAAYFLHNQTDLLGNLVVYSPFMGFVGGLILLFRLMGAHRYFAWRPMLLGWGLWGVFAGIWIVGWDFRVSLDLKAGLTPYFADLTTNAMEFVSVLLASLAMVAGTMAGSGVRRG